MGEPDRTVVSVKPPGWSSNRKKSFPLRKTDKCDIIFMPIFLIFLYEKEVQKMKKIISLVLASLMMAAMLSVAAGAQSQAMNGTGWDPENVVNVKKTDPSNVVKDGVIGATEYEKFEVDLSEESSPLHVTFITGDDLQNGLDMLATMEYYFSWDEVHGINIAIRNKPAAIRQLLDVKESVIVSGNHR